MSNRINNSILHDLTINNFKAALLLRVTQSKQSIEMLVDLPCVHVTRTVLRISEGMLDRCHYLKSAFTLPKSHEFVSWKFGRLKTYNLFVIDLRK